MKRLIAFLLFFYPLYSALGGSWKWDSDLSESYQQVFRLQFNAAQLKLSSVTQHDQNNIHVQYLNCKIDFLKAFISEEDTEYQKFKRNKERFDAMIESSVEADGYKGYYLADVNLFSAILRFKRGETVGAAIEFRKSYKLLEKNEARFPEFIPHKLSLGFLHSVIGAVPENYKWIVRVAGFKGSIKQGLMEIQSASLKIKSESSLSYLKQDAEMMYLLVKYFLDNDVKTSAALINKLGEDESSPLMVFIACSFYNAHGKSASTISLLDRNDNLFDKEYYPMYYLQLQKASAYLYKLDKRSVDHYTYYVTHYKGNSFVKAAYQRLAWSSAIVNDTVGFYKYMAQIKNRGSTFTDEDKQSQKESINPIFPNVYLLRARLLFDGGYYLKAQKELSQPIQNFPTNKDQIELVYRMARIKDKQGETERAVEYYSRTYEIGKSKTYYFAANAALQLGLLYENKGEYKKAKAWFLKCLELRDHEYQNSIDQKAEAGLNRIDS
ncbi:MAG TPA: tetratricopeptide repeat protein [Bacteroidia bacterium]|nr:tetratricopeptide repeat protein [Bacteroidia bacterium]HNT80655.1 tetratricopeptide repeat protein [Bacteroidia bacterium]